MGSGPRNTPDELAWMGLAEVSRLIQKRTVSPVELTELCLARIEQFNPRLNAFITVTADSAREEAKRAEAEIARGNWRGPLHGIPLALKDLVETAGVRTTAASAVLQDYIPAKDAHIVQRLKEAGVVLLGKLNLHEFAYGGSGIISHFGVVRNPWDQKRITGGSSSGSAAAVAAGLCYGAIGTDTAGSIRLPASFCGVVGLKPSYGLVSARGVIPLSWTQDHVGPLTRTVADAALMLQVIASYDARDIGSQRYPAVHYPAAMEETRVASLRLGTVGDLFGQELDPEVDHALQEALAMLTGATAGAKSVSIPMTGDRTVVSCEAFTYHEQYLAKNADKYHPETLRRIRAGADVTAPLYIGNYRNLQRMRRDVLEVFEQVDVLVTPTTPVLPDTVAELETQPDMLRPKELTMLRNTRPFNVLGLPTITVPCGFSKSGLPIGLQLSGAPGKEATVLALAHAYEQQTEWHKKKPPVWTA
jgi:aspartyl-tRNA(Asn)/glutamyl-tRNA(Gln) amidotransferase subunit A